MESPSPVHFGLLTRRLELIDQIFRELNESRRWIAQLDCDRLERSVARQESLCAELRVILRELRCEVAPPARPEQSPVEDSTASCDWLMRETERGTDEASVMLRRAVRVHTALLRRSRRSINVLMNVLSCSAENATYGSFVECFGASHV